MRELVHLKWNRPVEVLALVVGVMGSTVVAQTPSALRGDSTLTVTATVDLGADYGQNFGSLFEIKDSTGRVIAGAGFPAVYNTRFRMDRQTLQFFARPPDQGDDFTLKTIPRPDDNCGLYMFDFAGRLYAINESAGGPYREWDADTASWRSATGIVAGLSSHNDGVVRVGSSVLRYADGSVTFNGRTILPAAAVGNYLHFYYANGRLFFYHTHRSETDGFTRICACRWTPDSPNPIDIDQADAIVIEPVGATTWAFGHLGDQVITVSNHGGVFVHDGRSWRVLRERVPNVSYQVYSVLTYYDRLLLGQYPTGEVFEFDGSRLTRREGFPPKLPTVSASARECQTLALYRGELYAGVWPWGEVWRYERDADRWHSLGRLFTHPEPSDRTVHPYEDDSVRHGLVANQWGQRVTSAVTIGNSMMFSTSAKSNMLWDPKFADFLSDSDRKEYGAVLQLDVPGSLSAPIAWKSGPTEFQFVIHADRLSIVQDGSEIGSAAVGPAFLDALQPASIAWGEGIFGALDGTLTQKGVNGTAWPATSK